MSEQFPVEQIFPDVVTQNLSQMNAEVRRLEVGLLTVQQCVDQLPSESFKEGRPRLPFYDIDPDTGQRSYYDAFGLACEDAKDDAHYLGVKRTDRQVVSSALLRLGLTDQDTADQLLAAWDAANEQ